MQGVKGFSVTCPEEPTLLCMRYNHWYMDQISIPCALVLPDFYSVLCGRQGEEKRNCLLMTVKTTWHTVRIPPSPSSLFFNTKESLIMLTQLCIWNCPSCSHMRGFFLWRKEPINSMALSCRCKQSRKTQAVCKAVQNGLCRCAACVLPVLTEGLQWRIHSITSL